MIPSIRAALVASAVALPFTPALARSTADRDAVRRAALDYVEGFYERDSTKYLRNHRA